VRFEEKDSSEMGDQNEDNNQLEEQFDQNFNAIRE
jgi:hypothetical protein